MEIEFVKLSYAYESKKVLNNVSFKIKANTITGLYGNNKSTILNLIDNLYQPTEGLIKYNDQIIKDIKNSRINKTVGYIKQQCNQMFYTNSLANEIIFIKENWQYKFDLKRKLEQTLKIVGLDNDYLEKEFLSLTEGEYKLVQIAFALITNPKVLLFNEPLEMLDYNNQKNILKLIKKLVRDYQKTVVIASNDIDLLYEVTDDIIIINNKKLMATGKTIEVFSNKELFQKNNIALPRLVMFNELAAQKGEKLLIHRDIKDLIKDVYKHV